MKISDLLPKISDILTGVQNLLNTLKGDLNTKSDADKQSIKNDITSLDTKTDEIKNIISNNILVLPSSVATPAGYTETGLISTNYFRSQFVIPCPYSASFRANSVSTIVTSATGHGSKITILNSNQFIMSFDFLTREFITYTMFPSTAFWAGLVETNDYIFSFGIYQGSRHDNGSCYRQNKITKVWSTLTSLPTTLDRNKTGCCYNGRVALLNGTKIYCVGGDTHTSDTSVPFTAYTRGILIHDVASATNSYSSTYLTRYITHVISIKINENTALFIPGGQTINGTNAASNMVAILMKVNDDGSVQSVSEIIIPSSSVVNYQLYNNILYVRTGITQGYTIDLTNNTASSLIAFSDTSEALNSYGTSALYNLNFASIPVMSFNGLVPAIAHSAKLTYPTFVLMPGENPNVTTDTTSIKFCVRTL